MQQPCLQKSLPILWVTCVSLCAILSSIGIYFDAWLPRTILKSLFMPNLMILVFAAWPRPHTKPYYLLQLGFLFAFLGDLCLALDEPIPWFFYPGVFAFLFQHAFYIWLNITIRKKGKEAICIPGYGLPFMSYIFLIVLSIVIEADAPSHVLCMAYSLILCSSFVTAFYSDVTRNSKYFARIVGFGIYIFTDAYIVINRYIYSISSISRAFSSIDLFLYYVAQCLICYGSLPDNSKYDDLLLSIMIIALKLFGPVFRFS